MFPVVAMLEDVAVPEQSVPVQSTISVPAAVGIAAFAAMMGAAALLLVGAPSVGIADAVLGTAELALIVFASLTGMTLAVSTLERTTKCRLLIGVVAVFMGVGTLLVLIGSPFPPAGTLGDQGFRIASIERFSQSLSLSDFSYRGLPAFYPPAFFYLLGRLSAWCGIPAYEALKLGLVAVAALVPICTYRLWSRLVFGPDRWCRSRRCWDRVSRLVRTVRVARGCRLRPLVAALRTADTARQRSAVADATSLSARSSAACS